MSPLQRFSRFSSFATILTLTLFAAATTCYMLFGPQLVRAIFEGRFIGWIDESVFQHRMQAPQIRDLAFYELKSIELLYRWAVWVVGALAVTFLAAWCYFFQHSIYGAVRRYFGEKDHAANLAVARIVVFGVLLSEALAIDVSFLKQVPPQMLIPPYGFETFSKWFPVSYSGVTVAVGAMIAFCFLAMLGLMTRLTTVLATLLSWYCLAVPQMLGKEIHNHHLIWFAILLCVSPCAVAVSLDAVFLRWMGRLPKTKPEPSVLYGRPLRMMWILFGVAYFFPGLRKILDGGWDWFMTDQLKYWIFERVQEAPLGQAPLLQIQEFPWLLKIGAFATIVWEISFIAMVLAKKTRLWAPLLGLFFHLSTRLTMGVKFLSIQYCYLLFINWEPLLTQLSRLGKKALLSGEGQQRSIPAPLALSRSSLSMWKINSAGIFLIAINCYLGYQARGFAWPFAAYPAFSQVGQPYKDFVEIYAKDALGSLTPIRPHDLKAPYNPTIAKEIMRRALRYHLYPTYKENFGSLKNLLGHFTQALIENQVIPPRAIALQYHREKRWITPQKRFEAPIERELLLEVTLPTLHRPTL